MKKASSSRSTPSPASSATPSPRPARRYADTLLNRAEANIPTGPGAPNQADLSRSVSDAYYALFHYIGDQLAVHLIGASSSAKARAARHVVARSVSHTGLKAAFRKLAAGPLRGEIVEGLTRRGETLPEPPPDATRFARAFCDIQQLRNKGDYDWNYHFSKAEVIQVVTDARELIADFDELPRTDQGLRWFLSLAVTWDGLKGR